MTVMFARTLWRVMSSSGRQPLVGGVVVVGGGVTVGAVVAVGAAVVGAGVALALPRVTSTSSRRLPPRRMLHDGQMRVARFDI